MKIQMTISGNKVHGVGYRPWLTDVAINCGLTGFQARNLIECNHPIVKVLAEGDDEGISYFLKLARSSKPDLAEVESIDVSEFTGSVMSLEKYASINTSSQLNKAIPLLLGMNNKMDQMLGKQDQMLSLQKETVSEIRELRDDIVAHGNTDRLARMEKDIRSIKAKIGAM